MILAATNPPRLDTPPVTHANPLLTVQNDMLSPQSSVGNVQCAPSASIPTGSRENDTSVTRDERHFIGNLRIQLLCIEYLNIVDRWRWQAKQLGYDPGIAAHSIKQKDNKRETFKAKWSEAHSSEGSTGGEMSRANGPQEVSMWLKLLEA
ncbi:hypothetical protein Tsubulata_023480 [Turnera subulata]|uniref:Uncharacterized protein n=1 Tax=Turnera subulata TaxID=218843 RepID=A0A9Q0IZB6_9ROSI|nr:hypothetical protein Tsubulata_023480 [Turnera subulata]